MIQNKKGSLSSSKVIDYTIVAIIGVIGIVILFQTLASLFPTLVESGEALNDSGFPLGELFTTGGAGWYILAAFVIVAVIGLLAMKKK